MEDVDQAPLAEEAHAMTLRARLGFETGKAWNTSLLAEGEAVVPIEDDYRTDPADPVNDLSPWSPIAKSYEINRLQLTNTSLPGTTLTLGRQRILTRRPALRRQLGWRQNEQTFDALRIVNQCHEPHARCHVSQPGESRVRTGFAARPLQRRQRSAECRLPDEGSARSPPLAIYSKFDPITNISAGIDPVRDSTSTYGLRFAGDKPSGKIKLAYARFVRDQTDAGDNPLDFDLDYNSRR